jgi:hypothetical protein
MAKRCEAKRYGANQCLRDADHLGTHADWMPEIGSERFDQGRQTSMSDEEVRRMWARYEAQGRYPDPVAYE